MDDIGGKIFFSAQRSISRQFVYQLNTAIGALRKTPSVFGFAVRTEHNNNSKFQIPNFKKEQILSIQSRKESIRTQGETHSGLSTLLSITASVVESSVKPFNKTGCPYKPGLRSTRGPQPVAGVPPFSARTFY
jgi:hypothetical protein